MRAWPSFDQDEISWFPRRGLPTVTPAGPGPAAFRRPRILLFAEDVGVSPEVGTLNEELFSLLFLSGPPQFTGAGSITPFVAKTPKILLLQPKTRLTDDRGYITREWWRYFFQLNAHISDTHQ